MIKDILIGALLTIIIMAWLKYAYGIDVNQITNDLHKCGGKEVCEVIVIKK